MTSHHSFPKPKNGAGRNLKAAITTGVLLGAIALICIFFVPYGWQILVSFFVAAGTWEVTHNLKEKGYETSLPILIIGGQAMIWLGQFSTMSAVLGAYIVTFMVLTHSRLLLSERKEYIRDLSMSMFVLSWIALAGVAAANIATMTHDGVSGSYFVVTFLLCVIASDVGGYTAGVLFGTHPMAPKISPKKSWEGFAGSMTLGIISGILCCIFLLKMPVLPGIIIGIILGAGLVICGTLGDLVESQFKREMGIKDMSNLLPGHGGFMDRMDSILPAAMVMWIVMSFVLN